MNKKIIWGIAIAVAVVGVALLLGSQRNVEPARQRATYFNYAPADLAGLGGLSSKEVITSEALYKWDQKMFELVSKNKLPDSVASRIYANVLVAQRDAAFLSFNAKGRFEGSIDAVSKEALCVFFVDDCSEISVSSDAYSDALARIVAVRVQKRKTTEDAAPQSYEIRTGNDEWAGQQPSIGIETKGWKPWALASAAQFRVPPPPHATGTPELARQLALVKKAISEITEEQKQSVVFWAGGPGTKTPPGQWIQIADDYMLDNQTPLEKAIEVRSLLGMAIADAVLAVYDSKYAYLVKRPFMRDSTILTIMPTPNHPSYPAGHATLSSSAAAVLSHAFPENKKEWEARMHEAGDGRTWGGIHFPVDNETGFALGERVAQEVIAKNR